MAAAANGIGVVGVAPEARIVPIKVLDDTGHGEWSNLICAVDYLTGLMTDGDPTNDVRVANMSLGDVGTIGTCTDGGIREAICQSVAAGVVYVAAAGNSTVDASTFIPAAFPEVIAVSALTDLDGEPGGLGGCWLFFFFCDDTLAEFSNLRRDDRRDGARHPDLLRLDRRRLRDRDGHQHGLAARGGRRRADAGRDPDLTPADVEDLLKSTRRNARTAQLADADGSRRLRRQRPVGQRSRRDRRAARQCPERGPGRDTRATGDRRSTSPPRPTARPSSGPVAVTATATDDIGVTKVDFFVNGALAATDTDGSDGWSMTWDASAVDAGRLHPHGDGDGHHRPDLERQSVSVQAAANLQGSWVGTYGHDGYILGDWNGNNTDLASLPAGVTYALEQGARATWVSPTTDVRALTDPTGTERRSQTFYDADQLRLRLSFATPYSGTLHLYAVDWDAYGGNRYENVTIDDGSGPQRSPCSRARSWRAPGSTPRSAVGAGGSVVITVDRTAGNSAVLAGLFLGGAEHTPPPPPPADGRLPGCPGQLARHVRPRRLRPRQLERRQHRPRRACRPA